MVSTSAPPLSIGVVVTYFRSPELLAETLASLQAAIETAGTDGYTFELVVVDDSGAVEERERAEAVVGGLWARSGSIRFVVNHGTLGIAESRNRGAAQVCGEYLHFIDQDDWLSTDFYREIGATLSATSERLDAVIADAAFRGPGQPAISLYRWPMKAILARSRNMRRLLPFLLSNFIVSVGQVVIRRATYETVGGFPEVRPQGADDWGLWCRLAGFGATIRYAANALFIYRLHGAANRRSLAMRDSQAAVSRYLARDTRRVHDLAFRLVLRFNAGRCRIVRGVTKATSFLFFRRYAPPQNAEGKALHPAAHSS